MAEFHDIELHGKFRQGSNSMEGKHLTGSIQEAQAFAAMLYPIEPHRILEITISKRQSRQFFPLGSMDNCGRAWFAELNQLVGAVIREVEQ